MKADIPDIPEEGREFARKMIQQVAASRGVTEAEMREEIKNVISLGMNSADPAVQAGWRSLARNSGEPSPEELVLQLSEHIRRGLSKSKA